LPNIWRSSPRYAVSESNLGHACSPQCVPAAFTGTGAGVELRRRPSHILKNETRRPRCPTRRGPRMRPLPEVRSRTGCQKTVRTPGQSRTGRWNDDASTPASHLSPVPVKMTTSFSGHYRRGQRELAQHGGALLRDHHPPGDTPRASWSSANLGRYAAPPP
jgi:hypothetical protein